MSDMNDLLFEAAYSELETIIMQLEAGDLSLEDSVSLYERGRKLAAHCQGLLDKAELRVNQISENGEISPLG